MTPESTAPVFPAGRNLNAGLAGRPPVNLIISGTNFWNPGDDFVREGVIRVLRQVFGSRPLNFLFYNFNPDFYPHDELFAGSNIISRGDLEQYRDTVDAVVVVGVSAGLEVKPLYRWILANRLEDKVYLISGHYESPYCHDHITEEPEATIFRKARIIIGRTQKYPNFIRTTGQEYHYVNCPALLSVPQVKVVPPGQRIERVGFSIQLPKSLGGLVNQLCAEEPYQLALTALHDLARRYQVEVVAHHKTEYFHFLNLLRGTGIPVLFSSFYSDFFEFYRQYDLVVTTRLHASLFANGHGIPGIIINDTQRHTHTLEGFSHSPWVNTPELLAAALARWEKADLSATARELDEFKSKLLARYIQILRPAMTGGDQPVAQAAANPPARHAPATVPAKTPALLDGAERILFSRTDSIGDAVIASGMLERIQRKYPQARLAVLCQQPVAGLFTSCPWVDTIICYDMRKIANPAERQQIAGEIAAFKPDVILNSVRSRERLSDELTLAFAEARHIAIECDLDNLTETDQALASPLYEHLIPTPNTPLPELERHRHFLRGLGIETDSLQPAVWTAPDDEDLAEAFFQKEHLNSRHTLALFPFTQHAIKDYPAFAEALQVFTDWDILLLGGPEAVERGQALAAKLPGRVHNLIGRTSLGEMAALLRRCTLLAGSDSCAAHIACAVGLPNVIVLGGGHFGRFLPYSPLTTAVCLPLECFGCRWSCTYDRPHCITAIRPETVATAIVYTLKNPGAKPLLFVQTGRAGTSEKVIESLIQKRFLTGKYSFAFSAVPDPQPPRWPSLRVISGLHQDNPKQPWGEANVELEVQVPPEGRPAVLAFNLRAGLMEWYPNSVLHVAVAVNGETRENLTFQTNCQTISVQLPLAPARQPYAIHIRSDQSFLAQNHPQQLAVQLRQLKLMETATEPAADQSPAAGWPAAAPVNLAPPAVAAV